MDFNHIIAIALNLLILVVVLGGLWWCFRRALTLFPSLPAPVSVVIDIVLVLVGLLIFVSFCQGNLWLRL